MLFGCRGIVVLMEEVMNRLLQAEMTAHLRATPSEQTDRRRGYRNGSYEQRLTTRAGTLELEAPRDREGTFQSALFERYQRSEKALVLAMMEVVVQGVSTRKVKKITEKLCRRRFSRETVSRLANLPSCESPVLRISRLANLPSCESPVLRISRLAKRLDEQIAAWAEHELRKDYPFLIVDAMQVGDETSPEVRRRAAMRSTTALVAVDISEDGYREIPGLEITFGETGEAWKRLFAGLKERGLSSVEAQKFLRVVTSDAHEGLEEAIAERFPGSIWQRCQAHFRRNVIDQTPKAYHDQMHQTLDRILKAKSLKKTRATLRAACDELQEEAPDALELQTRWRGSNAVSGTQRPFWRSRASTAGDCAR